jgi:hypothetical protein
LRRNGDQSRGAESPHELPRLPDRKMEAMIYTHQERMETDMDVWLEEIEPSKKRQ